MPVSAAMRREARADRARAHGVGEQARLRHDARDVRASALRADRRPARSIDGSDGGGATTTEETRAAFPDQRNELIALHHADDAVIVEFDLLGTHNGQLPRPAADRPLVRVPDGGVLRVRGRPAGLRARLLRLGDDPAPARDRARPAHAEGPRRDGREPPVTIGRALVAGSALTQVVRGSQLTRTRRTPRRSSGRAALGDHPAQQRRRAVALLAELLVQGVERRQHVVELDQVGPLERPARVVVAVAHRDVDVLGASRRPR